MTSLVGLDQEPYRRRRELVEWCRPGGHIVAVTDMTRFLTAAPPTLLAEWVGHNPQSGISCTGCQTWLARQKGS